MPAAARRPASSVTVSQPTDNPTAAAATGEASTHPATAASTQATAPPRKAA